MESRDNLDDLSLSMEMDYPQYDFSREELRHLVSYAITEFEMDRLAATPISPEPLERKINRALSEEVDRIQAEMSSLQRIAGLPDGNYKLKATQRVVTPQEANDQLAVYTRRLLEIKKLLVEQKKADTAAKQGNVLNMQINVGDVISNALSNIRKAEAIPSSGVRSAVVDAKAKEVIE
jgi:hypothetical protein